MTNFFPPFCMKRGGVQNYEWPNSISVKFSDHKSGGGVGLNR